MLVLCLCYVYDYGLCWWLSIIEVWIRLKLNNNIIMGKYKTINSLTQRPSVTQIASYLIVLMQILIFAIIIQNRFASQEKRVAVIVILSLLFASQVIVTLVMSLSDPSDDLMIKYRNQRQSFTNQQLDHLLFCDICHSYVQVESKHCRACQRCVSKFDHHCIWINNCVGSKNYKMFLLMVTLTFLTMLMYIISIALLWAEHNYWNFVVEMGFVWASGVIVSIFALLITNLLGLHIYLAFIGLTTYQFIMKNRDKQKFERNKKMQQTNQNIQFGIQKQKSSLQYNQFSASQQNQSKTKPSQKICQASVNNLLDVNNKEIIDKKEDQSKDKDRDSKNKTKHNVKLSKIMPVKQNDGHHRQQAKDNDLNRLQSSKMNSYFYRNRSLKLLVNNDALTPSRVSLQVHPSTTKNKHQTQMRTYISK